MTAPAAFSEAMIERNREALLRAQGACPAMAALQPGLARAVPDAALGLRIEIRTRDDRWVPLDGADPVAAASRRVGQFAGQKQIILVGLGLGYALDRLERAGSDARVLAFEPDPAVATLWMARRDWRDWIESGRLRLLVGPDYAGATATARWVDVTTTPVVSVNETLAAQRPKSTQGAQAVAARVVSDAEANLDARRRFAGRYLLQTLGNLPVLLRESDAARLDGLFAGVPAVVVGAGPSLDVNVRSLAHLQDRAVIIAADTALRPLLAGGVRPHLVVGVDPAELNARHVAGLDGVDGTWLVGEGSLHPAAFEPFEGRTFTFKVSRHEPWPWVESKGAARGTLRAWGSVVTSAFDLAVRLGCTPVAFAGLDLAYTNEQPYCSNTLYDTTWRDVLMACHGWTFEQLVADYFANRTTSWETDLHGRPVRTAPQLLSFRNWLLDQVARPSATRYVNTTGGGMLYGPGLEQASLDEVLGPAPVQSDLRARLRDAHAAGLARPALEASDLRALAAGQGPEAEGLLARWKAFTLDTVEVADIVAALETAASRLGSPAPPIVDWPDTVGVPTPVARATC